MRIIPPLNQPQVLTTVMSRCLLGLLRKLLLMNWYQISRPLSIVRVWSQITFSMMMKRISSRLSSWTQLWEKTSNNFCLMISPQMLATNFSWFRSHSKTFKAREILKSLKMSHSPKLYHSRLSSSKMIKIRTASNSRQLITQIPNIKTLELLKAEKRRVYLQI